MHAVDLAVIIIFERPFILNHLPDEFNKLILFGGHQCRHHKLQTVSSHCSIGIHSNLKNGY